MNDKEENELAHEGTDLQFSAIKNFSLPVPFRPATQSLCKHQTRPHLKAKNLHLPGPAHEWK